MRMVVKHNNKIEYLAKFIPIYVFLDPNSYLLNQRPTLILSDYYLLLKQRFFTTSKTDHHLLRQKIPQRISVMKTSTGVFVVFETKRKLECQFSGKIQCVCCHY